MLIFDIICAKSVPMFSMGTHVGTLLGTHLVEFQPKNYKKMQTQIIFDHRNRTKKDEEGPIEIRITHNRARYYINTGVRVRRSEFAFGSIINRGNANELNEQLYEIVRKVTAEATEMIKAGEPVDAAEIKRRVWSPKKTTSRHEVVEWINEQMPLLSVTEGTLKHYHPLLQRLVQFDEIRAWRDVTVENIYKFDAFLRQLKRPLSDAEKKAGFKPEKLSDAGVYNYHKTFKAMLNRALAMGVISENPYNRLKGAFPRGEKETVSYLTEEEMEVFLQFHPLRGSMMDVAHDLFVFQMFTGLSFSDMQNFNARDYKLIDGTWKNVGERVKTGVPYVSQLLPPVVEVLEKYGWSIPKITNPDYNKCLKAIGIACGIKEPLHSHMARHTFATYALRKGVKIENLSRMLGHTNITQTQRYAKVMAEAVFEDFELLKNAIEKK